MKTHLKKEKTKQKIKIKSTQNQPKNWKPNQNQRSKKFLNKEIDLQYNNRKRK